ncbi:RND transporter [Virgibacillus flavescens]|uniref:RND transporter n=1 Tax=Virgibacillus flavescens TaxID=1611422 RepID=UPI003D34471A
MINKKRIKKVNWSLFSIYLVLGVLTAIVSYLDLSNASQAEMTRSQSRIEFGWNDASRNLGLFLLLFSVLLIIYWKKLFPFNVPIAIILMGFYFELFFLVYFTGWVGIQGALGLIIALLTGIIMIIIYGILRVMKK